MAPVTNTVHVILPPDADVFGTQAAFGRFGEVAHVDPLGGQPPKVAVAFFDVRSAARAVEALGRTYCVPGPQSGERTVRLAGDARFNADDLSGISGVQCDGTEGCVYTLEFFDIRDAARYQDQLARPAAPLVAKAADKCAVAPPPGLEAMQQGAVDRVPEQFARADVGPPPGLEIASADACFLAPPGLEGEQEDLQEPTFSVTVSGLPNKLLSEGMMEAILQQAGLEEAVLGFSMRPGKPCGKVFLTFSSYMAAEACASHFAGCQWDPSGTDVTAQLVLVENKGTDASVDVSAAAQDLMPQPWLFSEDPLAFMAAAAWSSESADEDCTPTGLSAGAPPFLPAASALSAEAPAFVPAAAAPRPQRRDKAVARAGSETSTEVGESEAEDEDSPAEPAVISAAP